MDIPTIDAIEKTRIHRERFARGLKTEIAVNPFVEHKHDPVSSHKNSICKLCGQHSHYRLHIRA